MTPWRARLAALRPLACALALALGAAPPAAAHEVPADVVVRSFVRAQDGRLRLLVRVPLASMRDVVFPLRGLYLDVAATRALLPDLATLWIAQYVDVYEEGAPLGPETLVRARLSLPSDPSFASWDAAFAHVSGGDLPEDVDLVLEQTMLDVLLEVPIASERSRFAIDPTWAHLGVRTSTVLRFLPPDGGERLYRWDGDPGRVELDPRWHQAALRFVGSGALHILGGLDHLLFLLCLVLPLRRLGALVPVVTAFTVAHSITLIAAAAGLAPDALWFPPLIETLVAASIVWMALENVVGARLERRWRMAFGLGLVHGFGFAFVLGGELQFAGRHLAASLLAFNVGVEVGQILLLALAVPALDWIFRRLVAERIGVIVLSVLVAHTAWHWMAARGGALLQYPVRWPRLDAAALGAALPWLGVAAIAAACAWGLAAAFGRWAPPALGAQTLAVRTGSGGHSDP